MKANQVLKLLQISRPTLAKYRKDGVIKAGVLPNNRYDYNEESVYKLLNKNVPRQTVIYGRVSTYKQRKDLENQLDLWLPT